MVSSDTITDSRCRQFTDAFFCKLITGQQWVTNTWACTDRVTNSFGQDLVYALTCGRQLLPSNPCTEQKTVNRKLEQTLTFVYYIYWLNRYRWMNVEVRTGWYCYQISIFISWLNVYGIASTIIDWRNIKWSLYFKFYKILLLFNLIALFII